MKKAAARMAVVANLYVIPEAAGEGRRCGRESSEEVEIGLFLGESAVVQSIYMA